MGREGEGKDQKEGGGGRKREGGGRENIGHMIHIEQI